MYSNYKKPQDNYTIWQAKDDIKNQQSRIDALEARIQSLEDEVALLRGEEWRALELYKILKRRIDMLETLVLRALGPEGIRFLTHLIIDELRPQQKAEAQNG